MENATKALMIAAAVIVAILIISLGIGIFNMASEQVDNAGDLSEYQIQQHNDKFKKYEGTAKTGSDVNAMLTTVFNHNNSQEDNSTCVKVTGEKVKNEKGEEVKTELIKASNSLTASPAKVSTGARYTVTLTYNTTTKLVSEISVTAK